MNLKKVLVVAKNEYLIAVTSKAFIIGLIMMPVFMGGGVLVQYLTKDQVDLTPRRIAVLDQSGKFGSLLEASAKARNENMIFEGEGADRKQTDAEFVVELLDADSDPEAIQIEQSDRVRSKDVFAFALIEPNVDDPTSGGAIRYFSETPSYSKLSKWLGGVVNTEIRRARIEELGLDEEQVAMLSVQAPVRQFGLVEKMEDGEASDAKEENKILTFAVPFGGLMLMFMMVMSVAPAMLNNVLEEKMQKISEFLVSSLTPFELMLGKLIGAIAVGMTLSVIYLGAAYGLAVYFDVAKDIPLSLYGWFFFYLLIALVIFGSVFSAIGAACSEIRDAQSLMTPVMLMVIVPMMCMGPILESPNGTFAKVISLFPPATPMLMFMRIAIPPGPAVWEIVLATVLAIAFAGACIWGAGRIFRIGILSQGQAPTLPQLVKWMFKTP